jgi:hypothetical protein
MEEIAMENRRLRENDINRGCKLIRLESVSRIYAMSAVSKLKSHFEDWIFLTISASQQELCSLLSDESLGAGFKFFQRKTNCRIK